MGDAAAEAAANKAKAQGGGSESNECSADNPLAASSQSWAKQSHNTEGGIGVHCTSDRAHFFEPANTGEEHDGKSNATSSDNPLATSLRGGRTLVNAPEPGKGGKGAASAEQGSGLAGGGQGPGASQGGRGGAANAGNLPTGGGGNMSGNGGGQPAAAPTQAAAPIMPTGNPQEWSAEQVRPLDPLWRVHHAMGSHTTLHHQSIPAGA